MSRYKQIKNAVMTAPWLIKGMLDKSKGWDPKLTLPVLERMLPYRIGIEIECGGNIYANECTKTHDIIKSVYAFSTDDVSKNTIQNEHRISITNFRQLIGLYNILQVMKENCYLFPNGGIHIHVDISHCHNLEINSIKNRMVEVQAYLTSKIDYLDSIFKYKGTYNKKKVGVYTKGTWVNLYTSYSTIEFRTVPQTFDYEELMVYIMTCVKVTKGVYKIYNNPKPANWFDLSKKVTTYKDTSDLIRIRCGKIRSAAIQRILKRNTPIKEIEYYI